MPAAHPRVPIPATTNLFGVERTIQVNHCRVTGCANFAVPARHQKSKPGPSDDRDMAYKIHSTNKGRIPSLRCKECLDNPPLKSNESIVKEIERLSAHDGLWRREETTGCRKSTCENHQRPLAFHPKCYRKNGKRSDGGQQYLCKSCGSSFVISNPIRLHRDNQARAVDVLSRIANKSPVRGTARGARLVSTQAYYQIVDFIVSRCRAYSSAIDRALLEGRLSLPADINVESDAQEYTLNWTSRMDRRNVVLQSYCTTDSKTRFILGLHANFDGQADPFIVNTDAARCGDMELPEAFRKYAHYWLVGDDIDAGRTKSFKYTDARSTLLEQIQVLYSNAASRKDVENIELQVHDGSIRTPFVRHGMQVHTPYVAYAHWLLLHRLMTGAGVKRVQLNTDINSMTRAAFLCAFSEEVRQGNAHLFYAKYDKYFTVDQRRHIMKQHAALWPALHNHNLPWKRRKLILREIMKQTLLEPGVRLGKWRDIWYEHPMPNMGEPHKMVSWLTADPAMDEDQRADLYLRAGVASVDNVFQMARRSINALERPLGTSSGQNTVWHGYQPYNPVMLEKYLAIYRTMNNFVMPGVDGRTPAMRLGFAKAPLEYEDILWPGQRVPRLRKTRRRGRRMLVNA